MKLEEKSYKVWDEGDKEDVWCATVLADNAEEAAEKYVENCWHDDPCDPEESRDVHVRFEQEDVQTFSVHGIVDVSFHAYRCDGR